MLFPSEPAKQSAARNCTGAEIGASARGGLESQFAGRVELSKRGFERYEERLAAREAGGQAIRTMDARRNWPRGRPDAEGLGISGWVCPETAPGRDAFVAGSR